jgi:hypothetical protein
MILCWKRTPVVTTGTAAPSIEVESGEGKHPDVIRPDADTRFRVKRRVASGRDTTQRWKTDAEGCEVANFQNFFFANKPNLAQLHLC